MNVALLADGLLLPSSTGATRRFLDMLSLLLVLDKRPMLLLCDRGWCDLTALSLQSFETILIHPADFYGDSEVMQGVLREHSVDVAISKDPEVIARLRLGEDSESSTRLIYDMHDLPRVDASGPMLQADPILAACLADGVMAINRTEGQRLAELLSDAQLIGFVPPTLRRVSPNTSRHTGAGQRIVMLGHFYYQPNADALMWVLRDVWPRIHTSHQHTEFHVVGELPSQLRDQIVESAVEVHGFVTEVGQLMGGFDVALSPITSGSGCRVKIFDYVEAGLPVVGTRMGFEGIEPTSHFIVCSNAQQMVDATTALIVSPSLRARLAAGAYESLLETFGEESVSRRLDTFLRAIERQPRKDLRRFGNTLDAETLAEQYPSWLKELIAKKRFRSRRAVLARPGFPIKLGAHMPRVVG